MISIDPTTLATGESDSTREFTIDEIAADRGEDSRLEPEGRRQEAATSHPNGTEVVQRGTPEELLTALLRQAARMRETRPAVQPEGTPAGEAPETTGDADRATPYVPVFPIHPITLKRAVSGRYGATSAGWRLELRVDVDGSRPLRRVSGDYYRVTGGTVSFFGSFVIDAITLTVTSSAVTITGIASTTWTTSFNRARVTIPRVWLFSPPAAATLRWSNAAGSPGASYTCGYVSRHFRSVTLEQDCEAGITPFSSYHTGSLPSGGSPRTLTIPGVYAEAGIEMASAGVPNILPAAPGSAWDNAELHNAMVNHFSLWRDAPQWNVWLFHASRYVNSGVLGIMFDQHGKQRQGCA